MANSLKIALAQLNFVVGDVTGNSAKIVAAIEEARDQLAADLVVFSELALCGYPPEDLLFHKGLKDQVVDALDEVLLQVESAQLQLLLQPLDLLEAVALEPYHLQRGVLVQVLDAAVALVVQVELVVALRRAVQRALLALLTQLRLGHCGAQAEA